jgi:hypothetical protein
MPIDMFIEPEQDPRTEAPIAGSELATLTGFLGWHRGTLELKCSGLDAKQLASDGRGPMSLRWVLNHMIEEYARHNGHADLLRERIDGAVGE